MAEAWKDSPRWERANLLGKVFRSRAYFDENEAEFQFSKKMARRAGKVGAEFVACAHGYVESDLGTVLEVDLITNADGEIAVTLKEYVWRHGMTPSCEAALEVFWAGLEEHWILVQARPDNLAVKVKKDGSLQIYAIDGYSFGPFINVSQWVRKEHTRKLAKLRRNQNGEFKKILEQRESGDTEGLGNQGIQIKSTE